MRNFTIIFLLSSLFLSSNLFGQNLWNRLYYRPIPPSGSLSKGTNFRKTLDGGYIFAFSWFWQGIENSSEQNYVIKTDSLFLPQWTKTLEGNNPSCFIMADSSIVIFSGAYSYISMEKINSQGIPLNSKQLIRNLGTPSSTFPSFFPVYKGNGRFKGFGNILYSTMFSVKNIVFLLDMDTLGNVQKYDTLYALSGSPRPVFFAGDGINTYYAGLRDANLNTGIIKMDSNNTVIWKKSFSTPNVGYLYLSSGIRLSNGDLLIGGRYDGYKFFLARISPTGNIIWAKNSGNHYGDVEQLMQDTNGDIWTVMRYQPNGTGQVYYLSVQLDGLGNILLAKYFKNIPSLPFIKSNNERYYINTPFYATVFNTDNQGNSLCYDSTFIIPSLINFTITSNPLTINFIPSTTNLTTIAPSQTTGLIYKDTCTNAMLSLSVDNSADIQSQICQIYPNPASQNIVFSLFSHIMERAKGKIYNAIGEKITEFEINPALNASQNISLANLKTGLYYFELETETKRQTGKFMIR